MGLPGAVFADEGVCEDDELSHDGGEGDFGLFAVCEETVVEGLERWIEAGGGDRGHVEGAADMGASALDVAGAAALAAVAGDRGEADEHGGLLGRQGADLGEADKEPISARPTMSAIAVTVPTPGMEVRMASRLARRGSAPIRASISASRFSIAVSAARSWRLISTVADRAVVAPSWLRRAVRAATAASRQRASSWRVSMRLLGGAAASGLRLSQRIASIRQSTRSVLAPGRSWPKRPRPRRTAANATD
jgi:hypothetical protein